MGFYKLSSPLNVLLLGLMSTPVHCYAQSQKPIAPATKPAEPTTKKVSHPFPLSSEVSYDSLRIMAHSGQSVEAIKLAEQYLKYRENTAIRTLLARMLAWNKQYDQARKHLQLILQKHPGDYDASDTLADIEVWDGQYDRAIQVIDSALKYDPDDMYLMNKKYLIQAKQYYANNKIPEAIQVLENRLKVSNSLELRFFLAKLYNYQKNFSSEKSQYEMILKTNPNNNDAMLGLVKSEMTLGNKTKALTLLDTYLKNNPNNSSLIKIKYELLSQPAVNAKTVIAQPAVTQGKTTDVIKSAPNAQTTTDQPGPDNKSVAVQPVVKENTYEKIRELEKKGQRQQAIQLAKDYLKTNDDSDTRVLLGSMLAWEKNDTEAREQFDIVLKKTPGHTDASIALASLELRSKNDEQALKVLDTALKLHPNNKDLLALKNRAEAPKDITYEQLKSLESNNQRSKAKSLAKTYLSKSENGDIRLLLGYMQLRDSEYQDAESNFKTVLKNSPSYTDASLGLARSQSNLGNNSQALSTINNALKHKPRDESLLEARTKLIHSMTEGAYPAGAFTLARRGTGYVPLGQGEKPNSLGIAYEIDDVSDLQQQWKLFSLQYSRDTSLGSIIATLNKADRFHQRGTQYLLEAYPRLFKGAYAYLGYGYSKTSYFPRNYIGFEPFFNLPYSFEFSIGERILQFQNSTTHLYTGSIAKYIGNYWIAFRPYNSGPNSWSYHFMIRKYFSNPENYITLRVGTGTGPSSIDDPTSLSSDKSRGMTLSGQYQLCDELIFNGGAGYAYEHFPNQRVRRTNEVDAGLTWLF